MIEPVGPFQHVEVVPHEWCSICLACFLKAGTGPTEESLAEGEKAHACKFVR